VARLVARGLRALAERIDPTTPNIVSITLPSIHIDGKELARAVAARKNGGTY
jgi:hypothetical protein